LSFTNNRFTCLPTSAGRNALLLSLGLLFTLAQIQPSNAQSTQAPQLQTQKELQQNIDNAVTILQQLDGLANVCLAALNEDASNTAVSETANEPCTRFLDGVDGELLARYLSHCKALRNWRDELVTKEFAAQDSTNYSEEILQTLIGVDYACADDALQKRTQFVTTAFAELQGDSAANRQQNTVLARRMAEINFEQTLAAERQRSQNALQQQQLQRELESERQLRQVETELFRQQRNQTIPPVQ